MNSTGRLPSPAEDGWATLGGASRFASLTFASPIDETEADVVRERIERSHGVEGLDALLATDGHRLLCRWRVAASASADAMPDFGGHAVEVWGGIVLELAEGISANVVVEDTRPDEPPIRSIFPYDRLGTCLITHRVTPVRVAMSLDGRRLLAVYHAPDAESVRRAQRSGSVCAGRVWACREVVARHRCPGAP